MLADDEVMLTIKPGEVSGGGVTPNSTQCGLVGGSCPIST